MSATFSLTIFRDGAVAKTIQLFEASTESTPVNEVILGRAEGCGIRLDDRAISRHHAVFKRLGDQIQIENKSEFAPLLLNGVACTASQVKDGDRISVGPFVIQVSTSQSKPLPSSTPRVEKVERMDEPAASQAQQPEGAEEGAVLAESDLAAPEISDSPPEGAQSSDEALPGLDDPQLGEPGQNEFAEGEPAAAEPELSEVPQLDDDGSTKISNSAQVSVKLIFKPGEANVEEYEIKKNEVTIGRDKACDIVLNDKKSSRKNTVIKRAGARFILKDLNSSNGTYVNHVRTPECELSGDDQIKIGNTSFQFRAVSASYAEQEKDFMPLPQEVQEPQEFEGAEAALADIQAEPPIDLGSGNQAASEQFGQSPGLPGAQTPGVAGIPSGMTGIAGITGIGGPSSSGKQSLMEKFRALPKRTQLIAVVAAALFVWWYLEDDEVPSVKKAVVPAKKAAVSASPTPGNVGPASFESLTQEKKQFVETQHAIGFEHYKNKEYDKAIFELDKIFSIIPDYKDAREIQRYAREGKRKMDAIEDERRKKEAEEKLKAKIAQLVEDARQKMEKKDYPKAMEVFAEILMVDPDNLSVANWKKEIDAVEEQKKLAEQQKQVEAEINNRAWSLYREASDLKKSGKYHSAIEVFHKAIDVGASDPKVAPLAKKMIAVCHATIQKLRDPVLAAAKEKEDKGEFSEAFKLYKKATRVDPPHPAGYAGMNRIKVVLHDRAKVIYTEAIIAESYSDFISARKLFEECMKVAPPDDIYFERSQRKLARFVKETKEQSEGATE